jgi:hypothetical protein
MTSRSPGPATKVGTEPVAVPLGSDARIRGRSTSLRSFRVRASATRGGRPSTFAAVARSKTRASLVECVCGHLAYEHHFNGYQDFEGTKSRGKCVHNHPMVEPRCPCVGFLEKEPV